MNGDKTKQAKRGKFDPTDDKKEGKTWFVWDQICGWLPIKGISEKTWSWIILVRYPKVRRENCLYNIQSSASDYASLTFSPCVGLLHAFEIASQP